jgi:DNA-directed RNA polymerase alpha subunit
MIVNIDIDDGGPAFPTMTEERYFHGMSLRDYFAARAMQGMLANPKLQEQILKVGKSWIEESAWAVSDAMIDFRNSKSKLLSHAVGHLELDVRTLNCLRAENIQTIGELCNKHTHDLRKVVNLGKVCLNNIVTALAKHGLKLKS